MVVHLVRELQAERLDETRRRCTEGLDVVDDLRWGHAQRHTDKRDVD